MSDNIKVVVKVRPLIAREVEDNLKSRWNVIDNTLIPIDKNGKVLKELQQFTFDKVYNEDCHTSDLYNDIVKPIVSASLQGINGTIFAYGQTSSGKTYTMAGTEDIPGITQLAVYDLFDMIKNIPNRDFLLRVSYIELYNETINDLLDATKTNIKIHDTPHGIKIDCTEKVTSTPTEMFEIMKQGELYRQIGATNMNEKSSRSHSIFQIVIESREHGEDGSAGEEACVCVSQLNLVDLAGSERGGQSGATGKSLKESTHINKSLSTLALVIKQLSEDSVSHTNYRDSKLTRILQNSLGGNANTSIICAVTPASSDETVSTLQFATRAKVVKNKPKVNKVHTNASMIQALTKKLIQMQNELAHAKSIKMDNLLLRSKIGQLQRQILNGPALPQKSDRRKTWCAPRRATISTLQPVPEHATSLAALGFIPISNKATPASDVMLTLNDEIIEIDSDEEIPSEPIEPCSPFHKCKESSKTPPCVLREKVKTAEKAYNDVIEMTELEKICSPTVVELEKELQKNTETITALESKVESLIQDCQSKDDIINQLNKDIKEKNDHIQQVILIRDELTKKCEFNEIKIAELEFAFETSKKKAKSREEDLLSMLKDKENSCTVKPIPVETSILLNFMDLSKDITLVNSDAENSIIENIEKPLTVTSEILQEELNNKLLIIKQLENEILEHKKQKDNLRNNLNEKVCYFERENEELKSTISTLNDTIKSQKDTINCIQKDIFSYNEYIHQLHIGDKEKKSEEQNIQSLLTIEEKLIDHNKFMTEFKKHNEMRESKIKELNQNVDSLKTEIQLLLKSKETELKELNDELFVLKCAMSESENQITLIKDINDKLNLEKNVIEEKNSVLEVNNKKLIDQISEIISDKDKIINNHENLVKLYTEQKEIEKDLTNKNVDLNVRINELTKDIECLHNKNAEQVKIEENCQITDCDPKLKEVIIQTRNILGKISNNFISVIQITTTDVALETLSNFLISIDSAITEEISKKVEILNNNEQLILEIANLSGKTINLMNIDKERCNNTEKLCEQFKQLSSEVVELTSSIKKTSEENDFLKNQLVGKNSIIKVLVEKDNKINEEIERINNLMNVKDTKYNEIRHRLDVSIAEIRNVHSKFREKFDYLQQILKNKNQEIRDLTEDLHKLQEKIKDVSETTLKTQHDLKEKIYILDDIYDKLYNLNIHNVPLDQNIHDHHILPSLIDNCVKMLKINQMDSNIEIEKLKSEKSLFNEKITELNKENVEFSALIQTLKQEMNSKKEEIIDLRNVTSNLKVNLETLKNGNNFNKDCCKELRHSVDLLKNNIMVSEIEDMSLSPKIIINYESLSEPVNKDIIMPPTLYTICCTKLNNILSDESRAECEKLFNIDTSLESNTEQISVLTSDLVRKIESLESENTTLKLDINKLVDINNNLYKDLEQSRMDIKSLIDLTQDLDKKIQNHRTNLTTLAATNYAENNLLKFKLKEHLYHHNRLHNVCQRDVSDFKRHLVQLQYVLHSEKIPFDFNNSLKGFSLPNVTNLNTSIAVKNESTLDGDLLMLDTNITMTTENASTIYDENTFDNTQILADNISVLAEESVRDALKQENLNSTLVDEHCKNENIPTTEPTIKKEDAENLQINLTQVTKERDEFNARCELYLSEIQGYQNDIEVLNNKVTEIQKEKLDFENKYNTVAAEIKLSTDLLKKSKEYQNDIENKSREISKLKACITNKNEEMTKLLDENTNLSSDLMDAISEVDTLKKEVDDLKLNQNNEMSKSFEKDYIIERCLQCKNKLQGSFKNELTPKSSNNSTYLYDLLKNEINASQEDCKGITEEIATIKNQLERNNASLNHSMDIDTEINAIKLSQIPSSENNNYDVESKPLNDVSSYFTNEREECVKYLSQKTGLDKENIEKNIKFIKLMEMLHDSLANKHSAEISNFSNKLINMQEINTNLESKVNHYSLLNSETCKNLENKEKIINEFAHVIQTLKEHIDNIKETLSKAVDYSEVDGIVNTFKDSIINVFDQHFGLSITPVYNNILNCLTDKFINEIKEIRVQYIAEQEKVEKLFNELNILKVELNDVKSHLMQRETEYTVLKLREEKLKEICNGVTLDLLEREKALKKSIYDGVEVLVQNGFIDSIDLESSSTINSINILFKYLTEKFKSGFNDNQEIASENRKLTLQWKSAADSLNQKEQQLSSMQQNLDIANSKNEALNNEVIEKGIQLCEQKLAHEKVIADFETKMEHLNNIIIKNLNEKVEILNATNIKYEDVINKLNEQVSVIKTKLDSEAEQKIKEFVNKVEMLENENQKMAQVYDLILKERENLQRELEQSKLQLKKTESEFTKINNEYNKINQSLLEKDCLIERLKSESEQLLLKIGVIVAENEELKVKVETAEKEFKKRDDEISQLQLNMRTLEKSAEIQSNIIKRIQKEKEDQSLALSERDKTIDRLKEEVTGLRYVTTAQDKEAILDQQDHAHKCQSKRQSSGVCRCEVVTRGRELRRSTYDANRTLGGHTDLEEMFSKGNDLSGLFPVKNEIDSGKSTPNSKNRSGTPRGDEEDQHDNSVSRSRLRRQSIHDMHRPALRNSLGNSSARKSKSARTSMEDSRSNKIDSDENIREELEEIRAEVIELRERVRELDEECDTCANYLHQRDEQCYTLNAHNTQLQARVEELTEELNKYSGNKCAGSKIDVGINTDEDWSNLHTVFVDRMSYDKEVDRNKQLTRALEEFHLKNRELKVALGTLERKLARETSSGEMAKLRQELEKNKKQMAVRGQEMEYLRSQCVKLQEQVQELTNVASARALSRQSQQDDTKSLEIAALKKQLAAMKETTKITDAGSAIVMNQQVSDVMRENQKLIRTNAKLMNLCKKRGVLTDTQHSTQTRNDTHDRENQPPQL